MRHPIIVHALVGLIALLCSRVPNQGQLGAPQPPDICDAGYDNVFVVTVPATGAATVTRLHFGVVSTACSKKDDRTTGG